MARIRKSLTFSNAIALVALFAALGGTVYAAGLINGRRIAPHSLPGNRIKPGTITGKQVRAGSLTGREGAGGPTGASGSLASVEYSSVTVPLQAGANTPNTGTANCPPGTKVIGGGATVSEELEDFVNDTGPTASRTGWTATGFANVEGTTMTVTAICTSVTASTG
jgi:hypothetical protein